MARKPDGKVARTLMVGVRLTPDGMSEVDRLRALDGLDRSTYFRRLLALDSKRRPPKGA